MKKKKTIEIGASYINSQTPTTDLLAIESYWKIKSREACIVDHAVWFQHADCLWEDRGDQILLHCEEEPTDEQITELVKATREKGWASVRFFGGSESFQRRARAEALKQGYPVENITLECEEKNQGEKFDHLPPHLPDYLKEAILKAKSKSSPDCPENDFEETYHEGLKL